MELRNFFVENKIIKWSLCIMTIFFIICIMICVAYYVFEKKYQNKIYPGIKFNNIELGGLTKNSVKEIFNEKINLINSKGIKFIYNDYSEILYPTISSFDQDLAYQVISFDVDSTVEKIYSINRKDNFFNNLKNKIKILILNHNVVVRLSMNETEINKILFNNFNKFNVSAKDAELIVTNSSCVINNEKYGKVLDFKKTIRELGKNLLHLDNSDIIFRSITDYPKIIKNECLNIEAKVEKIVSLAPIILKYKNKEWEINKKNLIEWLILKRKNSEIVVDLKDEKVFEFLEKNIALKVNIDVVNGKFRKENTKVVEFKASKDGQKLNIEENIKKIKEAIKNKKNKINLMVDIVESVYGISEINNIGINELVGIGISNFSGSPSNRRHNIKIGADAVNGILVAPEEEFSLVKVLGDVDAKAGYLPELVIKGNKTVPEYGGGLCQIATTLFRATINSGFPVTARQGHSYRVSYYEPAGTDAAVYSPWPDFRFLNDTNDHVLIQARIVENNLYFDFWGTKDGRKIEITKPVIYNIVKPELTKIIETLDLPVGEKKCTEHAHDGASAYFDYKVEYSNGDVKEKRFSSYYVPWQEVCLIGVEKLSNDITNLNEDLIINDEKEN